MRIPAIITFIISLVCAQFLFSQEIDLQRATEIALSAASEQVADGKIWHVEHYLSCSGFTVAYAVTVARGNFDKDYDSFIQWYLLADDFDYMESELVTFIISANKNMPPVIAHNNGLPAHMIATKLLMSDVKVTDPLSVIDRILFVSPFEIYVGVSNRERTDFYNIFSLGKIIPEMISEPLKLPSDIALKNRIRWNRLDFRAINPSKKKDVDEKIIPGVPDESQPPDYPGSCGPTSSANILKYWDNRGFERLMGDKQSWSDFVIELGEVMGKPRDSGEGAGVGSDDVKNGVLKFCNNSKYKRKYDFKSSTDEGITFKEFKAEIDASRPFVFGITKPNPWSENHMVTAVGYSDESIVVHDNWKSTPEDYNVSWDSFTSKEAEIVYINPGKKRPTPELLSPKAGDVLESHTSFPIMWIGFDEIEKVKIELLNAGKLAATIDDNTDADAPAYFWSVPGDLKSGNEYTIKVTSVGQIPGNDPKPVSATSEKFKIKQWIPEVTKPAASMKWKAGQSYYVRWSGFKLYPLKVSLYKEGKLKSHLDTYVEQGTESYFWTIPITHPGGEGYTIRVESIAAPAHSAESGVFSILPKPKPEVTAPAKGDSARCGEICNIEWINFSYKNVSIALYKGTKLIETIVNSTRNDGKYPWKISKHHNTGNGYHVRVFVESMAGPAGILEVARSGEFNIEQRPDPEVIAPAKGDRWERGKTHKIRWSGFICERVKIELYDGLKFMRLLHSGVKNSAGAMMWRIPSSEATGKKYRMRITSTSDPDQVAKSEDFTIFKYEPPEVTSPAKNESWQRGERYSILWNHFPGDKVMVELYRGNSRKSVITSSTGNDGTMMWTVPADLNTGTDYRIRITTIATSPSPSGNFSAYSAYFSVVKEPTPKVTKPKAGDIWQRGNNQQIFWSGFTTGEVKIQLYKGTGVSKTIASATANDGSFTWMVPLSQSLAANYKVKITAIGAPSQNAYSDKFEIIKNTKPKVTSPDGSIAWKPGNSYPIRWNTFKGTNVKIQLFQNSTLIKTIASSTSNDGLFNYSLASNHQTGNYFRIKVTSTSNTSQWAYSSYFPISASDLPTVENPYSGAAWECGKNYLITWKNFSGSSVMIELFKGASLHSTLASSTSNNKSWSWYIAKTHATGSDFRVKVTSSGTTPAAAQSAWSPYFTIKASATGNPQVTNPPADNLERSRSYPVNWSGYNGSSVKIELYYLNSLQSTITTYTSNDGSYTWSIPANQAVGEYYRIKITSYLNTDQFAYSGYFSVVARETPSITDPSYGNTWIGGTTQTIRWNGFASKTVAFELYRSGTKVMTLAYSTSNDGVMSWTVPTNLSSSTQYRIKGIASSSSSIYTYSDYFEISPVAQPKVTEPSTGDTWYKGNSSAYHVRWSGFPGATVNISLQRLYNGVWTHQKVLTSSTDNNGDWWLILPSDWDPPHGSQYDYRIRVRSADGTTEAFSGTFKILN